MIIAKLYISLTSDDDVVEECGMIEVTSYRATLEDQTYEIECGEDGNFPVGRKVRVRLEDTNKPLEIAEIYVYGDLGRCPKLTFDSINYFDIQDLTNLRVLPT